MSAPHTIVAVARDQALLQSLAFALTAHGYAVSTHQDWASAEAAADRASCVVVDSSLSILERKSCIDRVLPRTGIVLMTESEAALPEHPALHVISKPLSGPDILAAIAMIVSQLRSDP